MAHNRHLVQGWLSVKENIVTILEMPLNFVADFQMHVGPVAQQGKINLSFIMSYDVLCAGPLIWTVLNKSA